MFDLDEEMERMQKMLDRRERMALGVTCTEMIELITRLREAEKDAVRYRWLRDNCTTTQADCLGPIFVMTVRRKEHLFNVGLSIDQAMKEMGYE